MESPVHAPVVSALNLEFDAVWFSYESGADAPPVLRDISFKVDTARPSHDGIRRQVVAILGPSGCGKSSLLHLVAGFTRPTRGDVRVNGISVSDPGPDRGMVFQAYASYPWLTVEENIAFGLKMRGTRADERKSIVDRYVQLVGLHHSRSLYPDELSGGMRQRVALARSLASGSSILLMDEPFGALDTYTKSRIQEEFVQVLEEEPKLVLFVTHDVEEALFLGDRVLILGPRPATVVYDSVVTLPARRDPALRFDHEFIARRRALLQVFVEQAGPREGQSGAPTR